MRYDSALYSHAGMKILDEEMKKKNSSKERKEIKKEKISFKNQTLKIK